MQITGKKEKEICAPLVQATCYRCDGEGEMNSNQGDLGGVLGIHGV